MSLLKKFESDSLLRKKIIILPVIIIVMFSILEIWVVNRLSTYGDQINKLEQNEESLRMENQLLENQIAEKSSLLEIEKLAFDLGYDRSKKFEYIKQDNLALN